MMRQPFRRYLWLGPLLALVALGAGCSGQAHSRTSANKKVIVLGIDGMDPNFMERHRESLPNLWRLASEGDFRRLATATPPQSPVAWSTFITGMDPGGHGIYDFIHRDPRTLLPFSSMSQTSEGGWQVPLGPYVLPLSSGKVVTLRKGTPFWQALAEKHVPVNIIRMPTNFPPVHCEDGVSVAGMGAPDLRGTFGTFTFYTNDPKRQTKDVPGGRIVRVELANYTARTAIQGPDDLRKDKAPTSVPLTIQVDPSQAAARFEVGGSRFILKQGEWSGWLKASFPLFAGLKSVSGIFRVYAKQLAPTLEIYVSPVNIDPADPAMPVTAPASYSRELASSLGPFYTQGMAQDTAALRQGVFNRAEYLAQSREVSREHLKLLRYSLERFHQGLLFFHFFGVDQDSHMLWGKYDSELLDTYRMVDDTVAWVRRQAPDAQLVIMSDHGFSTFDRAVHLNAWLMKEGFLTLDDPKNVGDAELFPHVDWSKTQAYSVGLNGLYLNLKGREREGIVEPGNEAAEVLQRISERMLAFRDPATGQPVVADVFVTAREFHGPMVESAPDLIVGYQPRYRSSWQTALGAVPDRVVVDNLEEWRADHCISPRFVPGVLITGRKLASGEPQLFDLTVSLMNEFGVAAGAGMRGHNIFFESRGAR
jgi:predicted AlkP superfamily phosphohydrolase/phosphomutase